MRSSHDVLAISIAFKSWRRSPRVRHCDVVCIIVAVGCAFHDLQRVRASCVHSQTREVLEPGFRLVVWSTESRDVQDSGNQCGTRVPSSIEMSIRVSVIAESILLSFKCKSTKIRYYLHDLYVEFTHRFPIGRFSYWSKHAWRRVSCRLRRVCLVRHAGKSVIDSLPNHYIPIGLGPYTSGKTS